MRLDVCAEDGGTLVAVLSESNRRGLQSADSELPLGVARGEALVKLGEDGVVRRCWEGHEAGALRIRYAGLVVAVVRLKTHIQRREEDARLMFQRLGEVGADG